jgi:class 3 adenylate cyclase
MDIERAPAHAGGALYCSAMALDVTKLTMTEIIRLQDLLSKELKRRFERHLALAFSDIVGSTEYFAHYGDEAGRKLQQRHVDLLQACLTARGGRIVDTAGDGAFLCFPAVDGAADALVDFRKQLEADNAERAHDHQLEVRVGVHWGPVLTDGVQVTGDAVNLCARIAGSAEAGEIRMSRDAFHELHDTGRRALCVPLPSVELKGVSRPIEVVRLDWVDRELFPNLVRIRETSEDIAIPTRSTVTFGRLRSSPDARGNDVVLQLPDKQRLMQISRWQFELRRRPDGLVLHQVSEGLTEVDGAPITRGAEVPIRKGTVVRVGKVMTLTFDAEGRVPTGTMELATRAPS